MQGILPGIINRNCKDAVQPFYKFWAKFHKPQQNHLCIASSGKIPPAPHKHFPQFLPVIQFPIVGNRAGFPFGCAHHRLMPAGNVNYCKAAVGKPAMLCQIYPCIVRPPAPQFLVHFHKQGATVRFLCPIVFPFMVKSCNSTHSPRS